MSVIQFFDRKGQEIEQDELIDRMSAEQLKQINDAMLDKKIITIRRQVGEEIKTFYKRVR